MILESIRIIADALEDSTYGVNAQLPSLDIDSGDTVPENIKTFADETRDILVALDRVAEPLPSINVFLGGPIDAEPEVLTTTRDADVPITIRIALSNDQAQNGTRDIYYYMRAVEKCLRDLGSNANAADRSRNNVQYNEYTDWRIQRRFVKIDDANGAVTLQIDFTARVRDINP